MKLADDRKGVLLVIGAKVTAGQSLAVEALMPSELEMFMKCREEHAEGGP